MRDKMVWGRCRVCCELTPQFDGRRQEYVCEHCHWEERKEAREAKQREVLEKDASMKRRCS